jgi:hypothetical protein
MRTTSVIELHAGERRRAANWGRSSTGVAGSTVNGLTKIVSRSTGTIQSDDINYRGDVNVDAVNRNTICFVESCY